MKSQTMLESLAFFLLAGKCGQAMPQGGVHINASVQNAVDLILGSVQLQSYCSAQVQVDTGADTNANININVGASNNINVPSQLSGFSPATIQQACNIALQMSVQQPTTPTPVTPTIPTTTTTAVVTTSTTATTTVSSSTSNGGSLLPTGTSSTTTSSTPGPSSGSSSSSSPSPIISSSASSTSSEACNLGITFPPYPLGMAFGLQGQDIAQGQHIIVTIETDILQPSRMFMSISGAGTTVPVTHIGDPYDFSFTLPAIPTRTTYSMIFYVSNPVLGSIMCTITPPQPQIMTQVPLPCELLELDDCSLSTTFNVLGDTTSYAVTPTFLITYDAEVLPPPFPTYASWVYTYYDGADCQTITQMLTPVQTVPEPPSAVVEYTAEASFIYVYSISEGFTTDIPFDLLYQLAPTPSPSCTTGPYTLEIAYNPL